MIEALLTGVGNALAFGIYFALSIIGIAVTMGALVVAALYWLERRENQYE